MSTPPDSPIGIMEWAIGILMAFMTTILTIWNGSQQMQIRDIRQRQDDLRDSVRREFREDLAEMEGRQADRHRENSGLLKAMNERLDRMTELLVNQRRQ